MLSPFLKLYFYQRYFLSFRISVCSVYFRMSPLYLMHCESFWANPTVLLSLDNQLHTAAGKNIGPGGWWKDMFLRGIFQFFWQDLHVSYQMYIFFIHWNIMNKHAGVTVMSSDVSPTPKPKGCWTNTQSFYVLNLTMLSLPQHWIHAYTSKASIFKHPLVRIWDLVQSSFSAALRGRQEGDGEIHHEPKINYEFSVLVTVQTHIDWILCIAKNAMLGTTILPMAFILCL